MRIQHNIMALNSYRQLGGNQSALAKNLEKLSSGYRINRAGDDAAGLAISEKMRAQIKGLEAAQKNANDGISLVQTGEGALTEVHSMLNRMVYLATQSANGTYDNETDRYQLQKELDQLRDEIDRIADSTNFNGIKLLDGKSLSGSLTKLPVEYNTISSEAGVTLDTVAGQGSKGEFTVDVEELFGTGDTLTFEGKDKTGALLGGAAKVLAFGDKTDANTFTGATKEEQAKSIADALKMDANYGSNFDIRAEGSKVILTAKVEGKDGASVANVTSTDKTVTLGAVDLAKQPNTAHSAGAVSGWNALFSTGGLQPEAGDKLTFNFTGSNGEELSATITITDAMVADRDTAKLTTAIANALSQANFDDNTATGVDESKMKVSDLFTITANVEADAAGAAANGGLKFEGKATNIAANVSNAQVTDAVLTKQDGSKVNAAAVETPVAATGTPKGQNVEVAVGTNNFTAGDVFRMTGKLSTGEDFTVELVAGKDFAIGATYKDSMDAIAAALTNGKDADNKELKITVGDRQIASNKIFGAAGDKKTHEFNIASGAGGLLTITSLKEGVADAKGVTNKINIVEVKTAPEASASFKGNAAVAQGGAAATITFDDEVKNNYGTTITIGDNNYEIVADARDVSSRNNEAVVIADLKNATTAEIADALKSAIEKADTDGKYTVTTQGNEVTVTTNAVGSEVSAIKVDTPYGDKITTASFAFDPKVVKDGSFLEFNGQKYQFVEQGKSAEDGAVAIEVQDFDKATSYDLGKAFQNVLKNGSASLGTDGTLTLKGKDVDGKLVDASVKFDNYLQLQIGDTADSYNQLTVNIRDMHTTAMGIDKISIADPTSAQAAIDTIRSAINYVSDVRGDLGAIQNRLEHTINNLGVQAENITAAESRIRDTDMAEEMMAYTKNNILVQAAQAMLAQANQVPQGVLQLLQ